MDDDDLPTSTSILLGRPFLKTARTKIDVFSGTLSMEFDGEVITFNIYVAMRYPSDVASFNFLDIIDVIEPATAEVFEVTHSDTLDLVLPRGMEEEQLLELAERFKLEEIVAQTVSFMDYKKIARYVPQKEPLPTSNTTLLPSIVQAPKLELK